jgi:hypothetical protein
VPANDEPIPEARRKEFIRELREACARAPSGDKVVTIHLFGIRKARELEGLNLQDLAERAGIGKA